MGTGISGRYSGTYGSHSNTKLRITSKLARQNLARVKSWAQSKAKELSKESKTQRDKFNTACVAYDETTDKYYYGRNGGIHKDGHEKNPVLFGDANHKGLLPQKSLNNYAVGNCAEVDAINNALNASAKLENLHITTIHATVNGMGKAKQACENCTVAFKGRVKENYTGWKEN